MDLRLSLSKVSFLPHQIAIFITLCTLYLYLRSFLLHRFFNLRLYVHTCHIDFAYSMFTECCLQHDKSIKWSKHSEAKISIPPTFQCFLKKTASLNACFPLFNTVFFISNFMKFQLTHTSCDFLACELIRFNGFQISVNKSYKILAKIYVISKKQKLASIFIRTTSLKLNLMNFNIFGSREYEKDWTFFKKVWFI